MKQTALQHEFVEYIPENVQDGVIYVSIAFATATHNCCCGCGSRVVTPLTPTDWKLIFDGETVSLYPSIGNWSFPCESHYWIKSNRVEWAPAMSRQKIEAGRRHDRLAKARYYGETEPPSLANAPRSSEKPTPGKNSRLASRERLRQFAF